MQVGYHFPYRVWNVSLNIPVSFCMDSDFRHRGNERLLSLPLGLAKQRQTQTAPCKGHQLFHAGTVGILEWKTSGGNNFKWGHIHGTP